MTHKGFSIIEETDALSVDVIFAVLYGLPGVGKTSTSFTMPKPILHIDADKGLRRAVQKLRPKSAKINDYGSFFSYVMSEDFAAYIKDNGIQSVVIDTVGTLLDDLIAPWLIRDDPKSGNAKGGLSLPGWGALKTNFAALKSRFQFLNLHVCCICHAKEEGEGNSQRFGLAVSGGSAEVIYRTADLIGFMTVQGERRIVNFNPTSTNIAKNVGNLPAFDIPNAESAAYDNFMGNVIGQVLDNMRSQSEVQIKFNTELQDWKDVLSSIDTPVEFDAFFKDAAALPEGLLKATVKRLVGERMVAKGFEYSKEQKRVVDTNAVTEKIEVDEAA